MTCAQSRSVAAALAAACVCALAGCVERRIFITSDPPGAIVWVNDVEVGRTPTEIDFIYFGVYDVRLRKEGFEPLVTSAGVSAPAHELPGIDLIAEALPFRFKSHAAWHFDLIPAEDDPDELIRRGAALRTQLLGGPASRQADGGEGGQDPIVIDRFTEIEGEPPR